MNRFSKGTLLAGTIMAGAMIATPAYAQDEDAGASVQSGAAENSDGDNFIVVTGSRIQQKNVDTAAPVAVVAAEEFELSGTVNVENVVNTLPQVVPGTTSFSNNPGNGTATLNLRGLGTNRTLVLVNGRRWVSFDTAQVVDLNTIPNFLLESVDVVTGGASAVYGSDALAGVVNFNLKRVEGLEMGGQYSITEEGDGASYQVYGAIGTSFDDGRGNATVYAEYYNRESVFQGDRAFSNFALGGETFGLNLLQFGSSTLPNGVLRYTGGANSNTGLPPGTEFGNAGESGFGNGVVFDDTPGDFRFRTGDTYNYAPVNYLQIPQERYLMGGYADYEFTPGHTAYTEVTYVNNRVQQELAATPVTGNFNVDLATVQPFLIPGDFQQLQDIDAAETAQNNADGVADDPGVVNFFVQRRTIETGARNSLDERNAFRVLAGVRGDITDNLFYDAYYSYARTRNANVQAGNISRSAFQAGLDGTGTPINIFGLGTLTPAMVQAISIQAQNGDISTQEIASASISGFLGNFGMGADDVGFAVGAEYRGVESRFLPDTALSSGDVIGFNAGNSTEGKYNVRELFAELNVPIFETDGGQRLELTGAARYSDYSLDAIGGVWTYAGGVEFQPIDQVTLRGQYQRAIRAPNVGELFGGQSIGFPGANDPCADPANANDQTVINLCQATGVPAGNVGDPNIQLNAQIPALFGGNPNLQEETSESYTFGIVLQPNFAPGLTITADYFDITIDDAVAVAGGSLQGLLDLCYLQIQDINSAACQAFVGTRTGNGAITVASPPLVGNANIASLGVSGVDLEINYTTDVAFGLFEQDSRLNFNFLGTYTESSFFVPVVGQPTTVECAGLFAGQCGEPTPEYKWTSRLSWIDGPLTTSVRWRHLDSVDSEDSILVDPTGGIDYTSFNGINTIDSYDLFDLSFSVEASENVTITAGIDNVFDTLPGAPEFDAAGNVTNRPNSLLLGDNQEQANTYPSTYDVLGRKFFVSAAFSF
ncbi:TonB-dependent receptor domain-containing protein [Qipengyuania nanhaisediminis]|uniref:TonB-dependent receptor domain-containing protein n=1 Tax=Qipengyuania nanhaisediminis TaxID=604088 RepID=UPI0038B2CBE2